MYNYDQSKQYQDMYDSLCDFEPIEKASDIAFRIRKGLKYRVGRVRLYVPTSNDHYEADYSSLCGSGNSGELYAGNLFKSASQRVASQNEYETVGGDRYSGRELLEKFGVLVGNDATSAIESFLQDAADSIGASESIRLGSRYGLDRGRLARILGSAVKVQRFKTSSGKRTVLKLVGNAV